MITVRKLLDLDGFREFVADVGGATQGLEREIAWAQAIDIRWQDVGGLDGTLAIAALSEGVDAASRVTKLGAAALAVWPGPGSATVPERLNASAARAGLALIRLLPDANPEALAEHVSRHIADSDSAALRVARGVSEELTKALVAGQGLRELLERAAELVDAPVILVTPGPRVIAAAGLTADEDPTDLVARRSARAEVEVHGWVWGTLHVIERDAGPSPTLDAILAQLPTVISIEVARSHAIGDDERLGQELVSDLLSGHTGSEHELEVRAELAGLQRVPDGFHVGLAMPLSPGMSARAVRAIQGLGVPAVHAHFSHDFLVLAVLKRGHDPVAFAQSLVGQLPRRSGRPPSIKGPLIAVGSPSAGLADAGSTLREARSTLALASDIGTPLAVVAARSFSVDRLVSLLLDDPELERFTNEVLGPLIEHDAMHSSQLVSTLEAYLRNGMSKTRTAQELFLRRQSLYRRLKRIEQVLGPLSHHEFRLKLQLALKAHRLLEGPTRRRRRESWWLELRR